MNALVCQRRTQRICLWLEPINESIFIALERRYKRRWLPWPTVTWGSGGGATVSCSRPQTCSAVSLDRNNLWQTFIWLNIEFSGWLICQHGGGGAYDRCCSINHWLFVFIQNKLRFGQFTQKNTEAVMLTIFFPRFCVHLFFRCPRHQEM